MGKIFNELKSCVPSFQEFLDHGQNMVNEQINYQVGEERADNIALATLAMLDAGLSDDIVIEKLQKYWDLRRSETEGFLSWAHQKLNK